MSSYKLCVGNGASDVMVDYTSLVLVYTVIIMLLLDGSVVLVEYIYCPYFCACVNGIWYTAALFCHPMHLFICMCFTRWQVQELIMSLRIPLYNVVHMACCTCTCTYMNYICTLYMQVKCTQSLLCCSCERIVNGLVTAEDTHLAGVGYPPPLFQDLAICCVEKHCL